MDYHLNILKSEINALKVLWDNELLASYIQEHNVAFQARLLSVRCAIRFQYMAAKPTNINYNELFERVNEPYMSIGNITATNLAN